MRYSVRGLVGLSHLEAVFRQCVDDLADHDVDEVLGLSIYFTPRSLGRRVEFRGDNGDVVDHIALEPVARKVYAGTATAVRAATAERPASVVVSELLANANSVTHLTQRWQLIDHDVATLLDSHPVRVNRILKYELPELMRREQERLALLLEIDRLYESLCQQLPIADWLRGNGTMRGCPGECPLDQLKSSDVAVMVRMRDALRLLADDDAPVELNAGFDAILDHPAQSSE